MKTSFTAREGLPAVEWPMIDLTSSNGKKNEAVRSEPVTPSMLEMASMIADKIAQRRGSFMPPVLKSVPRRPLRVKSSLPLERFATMKIDKVDFAANVVPRPILLAAEIGSPTEKEKTAHVGSYEKSINPVSGEAIEICALLKPDGRVCQAC